MTGPFCLLVSYMPLARTSSFVTAVNLRRSARRSADEQTADQPQRASQAGATRCAAPRARKRRHSNLKPTNRGFGRSGQERSQERPRRKHGDETALPRDRGGARDRSARDHARDRGGTLDCRGARDRGARARDNHARDRRQTGLVAAARRERCAVLARGVDVDHRDAAPRRCWTAIRHAIAEACSDSNTSK